MTYEIGQSALLSVTFLDINQNPTNPSAVTLLVRDPTGAEVTYTSVTITNPSTGVFNQVITVTIPGIYTYEWTGTGTLAAVIQGSLTCAESILSLTAPNSIDLTTLDVVKAMLNIPPSSTIADITLAGVITQASLFWLKQTARMPDSGITPVISPFVEPCSFNEWYDGSGSQVQFVKNPPIRSLTAVIVNNSTLPSTSCKIGYDGAAVVLSSGIGGFLPTFRSFYGGCGNVFNNGLQNVNIQYMGGYDGVPFDVGNACAEMIVLTYKKRGWVGLKSLALAQGGGTTSYQTWAMEPWIRAVMNSYSRKAIV